MLIHLPFNEGEHCSVWTTSMFVIASGWTPESHDSWHQRYHPFLEFFRPDSLSALSGFLSDWIIHSVCLSLPHLCFHDFFVWPSLGVQKISLEELPVDANKSPSSISDVVANYQLLCNSFSTENSSVRLGCEGLVGWKPSKWKMWEVPHVNLGNHWNQRWSFLSEVVDFRFVMFAEFHITEEWRPGKNRPVLRRWFEGGR